MARRRRRRKAHVNGTKKDERFAFMDSRQGFYDVGLNKRIASQMTLEINIK